MNKTKTWILSILLISFFVISCEKEEVINEAQVLVEFLESADSPLGKDYVNTEMPAIIKSTEVHSMLATNEVYVIDIRGASDFAAGHIAGAVNISAGDIITHLESVDLSSYLKVAVVCYSGQSAAWATCLARIKGYAKVYSMKWGMCSWNSATTGSWDNNVKNTYLTEFTSDVTAKGEAGELPALSTGLTTGQEILDSRVATVAAEGFGAAAIGSGDVWATPGNYYIVNYWSNEHYTNPGHIPGAMQYTPKESIALATDLKTLPTDKTIVVYCYTGQTSANMAAYLRVLGYDAKSLKFGVNGMIYDNVPKAKWGDGEKHDYELVTD